MIIEIPGKENQEKADKLAMQLKDVFQNSQEVRVNRPEKIAEIRIRDLDDSVSPQETAKASALKGECRIEQVTVGEVRHPTPRSMGTIWAHYRKIAQQGRIVLE